MPFVATSVIFRRLYDGCGEPHLLHVTGCAVVGCAVVGCTADDLFSQWLARDIPMTWDRRTVRQPTLDAHSSAIDDAVACLAEEFAQQFPVTVKQPRIVGR